MKFVTSAIGELREAIIHIPLRPSSNGKWMSELAFLNTWNKDVYLYDDLPCLRGLYEEYETLRRRLEEMGVKVRFLRELLKEALEDSDVREEKLRDMLGEPVLERYEKALRNKGLDVKARELDTLIDDLIMGFPRIGGLGEGLELHSIIEPLPNLCFIKDVAVFLPEKIIICNMRHGIRKREPRLFKTALMALPYVEEDVIVECPDEKAIFEGSCVMVIDESTAMIGVTRCGIGRVNEKGFAWLVRVLSEEGFDRVIRVELPVMEMEVPREMGFLDFTLSFVDKGLILTLPYLYDRPEVLRMVKELYGRVLMGGGSARVLRLSGREARVEVEGNLIPVLEELGVIEDVIWAAPPPSRCPNEFERLCLALRELWNASINVLTIGPGKVVAYEMNVNTVSALREKLGGENVMTIPGAELVRGRGGPGALVLPVVRR